MASKSENLLKRLLATFKPEAEDHLRAMSSGLLELEKEKDRTESLKIIESIYREAHSLKGAARAVNLLQVETLCQAMESVFAAFKHGQIPSSAEFCDAIHQGIDTLTQIVAATYDETIKGPSSIKEILQRLSELAKQFDRPVDSNTTELHKKTIDLHPDSQVPALPAKERPVNPEVIPMEGFIQKNNTVRISTNKLDALLIQVEGMLSIKLGNAQRSTEIQETCGKLENWFREWTRIQPDLNLFQKLIESSDKQEELSLSVSSLNRLNDFWSWTQKQLKSLQNELLTLSKTTDQDSRTSGRMVDDLLEDMKQVVMLPCSTLLESFPKIVRDLSRLLGKEIEWSVQGEDIEMDKRILEEIKDPLVHLIRNCVDHGIESPDLRERLEKSRKGTISLVVNQAEGGKLMICVSDDGAGIDFEKVKTVASKHGWLTDSEESFQDNSQLKNLIFRSELSTSSIITNISGRGLGLAIVKEKVAKLGGHISVKTTAGAGTSFCITLPVSLATFRGILIREGGHAFIVPSVQVECVTRVESDSIRTVENRDTIIFDQHPVPLVPLEDALSMDSTHNGGELESENKMVTVLILGTVDQRIAFSVSQVLQEQEVLVKKLPYPVLNLRNVSGATLLGDGRVAPILSVAGLIQSALEIHGSSNRRTWAEAAPVAQQKKSILVAEDSITSRMLLQNILESANYQVQTEVDGMAAYAALKTGNFDLLVSDVQMPRMDGFELTAKIRRDDLLSDMPVVLVTSLERREDRELGVEAGANAYIVKSSFDQSDLLEVIGKLL